MTRNDKIDLALQSTFGEMFRLGFSPEKIVMIANDIDPDVLISISKPDQLPDIPSEYAYDSVCVKVMPESPVLGDPETIPDLYVTYLNFLYGDNSYCEVLIPTQAQLLWYWLYQSIGVVKDADFNAALLDLFLNTPNQSISDSWEYINDFVDDVGELAESLLYLVQQSQNEKALNKWIQLIRECSHIRTGDRRYLQDVVEGTWISEHISLIKTINHEDIDHNQWLYEFESDEIGLNLDSSVFEK